MGKNKCVPFTGLFLKLGSDRAQPGNKLVIAMAFGRITGWRIFAMGLQSKTTQIVNAMAQTRLGVGTAGQN